VTRAGLLALAFCVAAAACASVPQAPVDSFTALATSCPQGGPGTDYLQIRPLIARQGETLALAPMRDMSPGGSDPVLAHCTSGWSVSDPALARLSRDHERLVIAADARPGAEVEVAYIVRGRRVASRLRIVGRGDVVLVGARAQSGAEGCGNAERVGEIAFSLDRFAVTFQPFESYKDYWGSYRYDPESGALVMNVDGGNGVPGILDLEGVARFNPAGQLVLEGFYLGDRAGRTPAPAGCRYTFG
jgi:hypothetical protein